MFLKTIRFFFQAGGIGLAIFLALFTVAAVVELLSRGQWFAAIIVVALFWVFAHVGKKPPKPAKKKPPRPVGFGE